MASFSTTEANATIDEKWDRDIEEARYANGVFLNRIANKSALVRESGDTIHVTVDQTWTVGDIGANGAFTPQVYTPDTVAITINQNKQVAVEVEDIVKAQSFWDPNSTVPTTAGKAYAAHYDTVIAGQHASFSGAPVGSLENPTAFGKTAFATSMLRLADLNVPKKDLSFFLPPIAFFGGLINEMQLTDADKSGEQKNVLTTGFRMSLLGVPFYESTTIATAGSTSQTRVGLLLHKSAMAIAFQRNNTIRRADRTAGLVDSYVTLIKSLYGLNVIRANHGVRIYIAAS